MSHPGMGVMIGMLGGNESTVTAIKESLGKTIRSVELKDDILRLTFDDGSILSLRDAGQSCCESRWMSTDADLPYYAGAVLQDISLASAEIAPPEGSGCYDAQFLQVHTSKGILDAVTHVNHNGYYGGFWIVATLEKA